jgi:hypothetical protein
MVGAINPNATTSLQNQKNLASQSQFMLLPGEPWPAESEDPFPIASASASTMVIPTSSPTPSSNSTVGATISTSNRGDHSGLSRGAIAGIATGAAIVLVALGTLLWFCGRNSQGFGRYRHGHVSYNPSGHMSFMTDPTKHMSMHSSSVLGHGPTSPALPDYQQVHKRTRSPSLYPAYSMSESLNRYGTASDAGTMHSTSQTPMYTSPVYNGSTSRM